MARRRLDWDSERLEVLAFLVEILGQASDLLRRLALVEGDLSLGVGETGLAISVKEGEDRDGDQ